jgi:hypothetical protein
VNISNSPEPRNFWRKSISAEQLASSNYKGGEFSNLIFFKAISIRSGVFTPTVAPISSHKDQQPHTLDEMAGR